MKFKRIILSAVWFLLATICLSPSAAAQNITPLLDCIEYDAAANLMTAHFGYDSRNAAAVTIPVGADNRFVPAPANRGQITVFQPGLHERAFSLTISVNGVIWLFEGQGLPVLFDQKNFCRDATRRAPLVTPLLTSIQVSSQTGLAIATFGYFSRFGATVGKGSANYFSFEGTLQNGVFPGDRGQPTTFQAGFVRNAFQITFDPATEPAVVWNLLGQTVVAAPPAAPTAASLSLSGALRNRAGKNVAQARLTLTNAATLETAYAQTNAFGHYRFAGVEAGEAYLLEINHKRHIFSPQIIQLFETREDFDLTAEK